MKIRIFIAICFSSRAEETLRNNFQRELDEIKRKYEEILHKQEDKVKADLQQIDKLSVEKKVQHENEKQKVQCIFMTIVFICRVCV